MRRVQTALILCLALLAPFACGVDGPAGPVNPVPSALETVGTVPGEAVVASTMNVGVRVIDEDGDGIEDVAVDWSTVQGGGSLGTGTSRTDASGETSVEWTLGTDAVQNRLEASVEGLDPATFTIMGAGPR